MKGLFSDHELALNNTMRPLEPSETPFKSFEIETHSEGKQASVLISYIIHPTGEHQLYNIGDLYKLQQIRKYRIKGA